jgi:hypothetical protein
MGNYYRMGEDGIFNIDNSYEKPRRHSTKVRLMRFAA